MPLRVYSNTAAAVSPATSLAAAEGEQLPRLRRDLGSAELLIVAGSGITEIYLVDEVVTEPAPSGRKQFTREQEILARYLAPEAEPAEVALQHAQGREAAARFLRSALGWLPDGRSSQQLATALRAGHVQAQNSGCTGAILNHLYERALWLCEKVRLETHFFAPAPSLATAIVEVGGKIFGDLQACTSLLVGAHADALEIAQALQQAKVRRLYFTSQTPPREEFLAQAAPIVIPLHSANGAWENPADLIVAFETAPATWHDSRFLQKLMQRRHNAPLLLADLSASPVRKEPFEKIYNLYYFSHADLTRLVEQNAQVRQEVLQETAHWIESEVDYFYRWLSSEDRYHFGGMVGKSPAMQHVFEWIARIARTDITVLLQGESGTGKELVARAVHEASSRAKRAFVVVNCGAIPDNLLESELFGHVRGAFTGAIQTKKGLFEEADGGTIFLDEIGELPVALQVKLLRFLQENEIKRVGSNQTLTLEVRVLAASNRDLQEMVGQGNFRSDLYYRLNVVQIDLPALRQRPEDVEILAQHFIRKFAAKMRKPARGLAPEALQRLQAYAWPGNVRELENVMERAVALALDQEIGVAELPESLRIPAAAATARPSLREMEKRYIIETLQACGGNYDEAARVLGIGRTTLWRKLKEYQMPE